MKPSIIKISISQQDIVDKATQHLSIVGKRAKDASGETMFSNLTFTEREAPAFVTFITSGIHSLVARLGYVCEDYSLIGDNATLSLRVKRFESDSPDADSSALKNSVENYLLNYTLAMYLTDIRPQTGAKYPPLFGSAYSQQAEALIADIINICYMRRKPISRQLPFTSSIEIPGSAYYVEANEEFSLAYAIDADCADDIEIFAPAHVFWRRGRDGFKVMVDKAGTYKCRLYSIHDESVSTDCTITAH